MALLPLIGQARRDVNDGVPLSGSGGPSDCTCTHVLFCGCMLLNMQRSRCSGEYDIEPYLFEPAAASEQGDTGGSGDMTSEETALTFSRMGNSHWYVPLRCTAVCACDPLSIEHICVTRALNLLPDSNEAVSRQCA